MTLRSDAPLELQVAARPGAQRLRHHGLDGDLVVLKGVLEWAGHEVGERDRAPAAATLRDHRPAEREHHRLGEHIAALGVEVRAHPRGVHLEPADQVHAERQRRRRRP